MQDIFVALASWSRRWAGMQSGLIIRSAMISLNGLEGPSVLLCLSTCMFIVIFYSARWNWTDSSRITGQSCQKAEAKSNDSGRTAPASVWVDESAATGPGLIKPATVPGSWAARYWERRNLSTHMWIHSLLRYTYIHGGNADTSQLQQTNNADFQSCLCGVWM